MSEVQPETALTVHSAPAPQAIARPPVDIRLGVKGFEPESFEQLWRLANLLYRSSLVPSAFSSPERVMVAMSYGMEIGLTAMQSVQSIAVIDNRPSIFGDAALGLVRASGKLTKLEEWVEGEGDGRIAYCVAVRGEETVERTFAWTDAVRAGLTGKGPWRSYPDRMLQMRARGYTLRDLFTDILRGMYLAEELEGGGGTAAPAPVVVATELITAPAAPVRTAVAPAAPAWRQTVVEVDGERPAPPAPAAPPPAKAAAAPAPMGDSMFPTAAPVSMNPSGDYDKPKRGRPPKAPAAAAAAESNAPAAPAAAAPVPHPVHPGNVPASMGTAWTEFRGKLRMECNDAGMTRAAFERGVALYLQSVAVESGEDLDEAQLQELRQMALDRTEFFAA